MARQKKPVHRVQMTEGKRNIIHQLLEEYNIQTAEDIQDALKDLLGGTIKEMMEAEMDDHLGYEKSERSDTDNYRNGYKRKRVNSSYGAMEIDVVKSGTLEPDGSSDCGCGENGGTMYRLRRGIVRTGTGETQEYRASADRTVPGIPHRSAVGSDGGTDHGRGNQLY